MFGWFRRKPNKLHHDVAQLAALMRAVERHLRDGNSAHWAEQVARCADIVEQSDSYGLDRFLGLFGGMGSLNDVVLHRDDVLLDHENNELHRLLNEAFELARRLKRERR